MNAIPGDDVMNQAAGNSYKNCTYVDNHLNDQQDNSSIGRDCGDKKCIG